MDRRNARSRFRWPLWGLALLAFAVVVCLPARMLAPAAAGGAGPPIVRVEEDWRLVLTEPEAEVNAPQFHTVMSPTTDANREYAQVRWNYRELPDFFSGGLQLEAWDGEVALDKWAVEETPLSRDAETITWTQRLELQNQRLRFTIINGHSLSWGEFGGEHVSLYIASGVTNLNDYSSDVSRHNSCVTFGGNRVSVLMITQVRRYGPEGLVSVDNTPIVVFQFAEAAP